MLDLEPLKSISVFDVLESLAIHVPDNVKHRRVPQIRCPLPDHEERSPSFTIYPRNNGWHCFGCGRGNDAIDLVRYMTGLDFRAAVDYLVKMADVEVGQAMAVPQTYEDVFPLVADQAHQDVVKWVRRQRLTAELITEAFAPYDDIKALHRNGEIDAQDAIRRMLAWRRDAKAKWA